MKLFSTLKSFNHGDCVKICDYVRKESELYIMLKNRALNYIIMNLKFFLTSVGGQRLQKEVDVVKFFPKFIVTFYC